MKWVVPPNNTMGSGTYIDPNQYVTCSPYYVPCGNNVPCDWFIPSVWTDTKTYDYTITVADNTSDDEIKEILIDCMDIKECTESYIDLMDKLLSIPDISVDILDRIFDFFEQAVKVSKVKTLMNKNT